MTPDRSAVPKQKAGKRIYHIAGVMKDGKQSCEVCGLPLGEMWNEGMKVFENCGWNDQDKARPCTTTARMAATLHTRTTTEESK